ncbi:acyl carrier protein [Nocardioides aromaticivorans]|uniref:Acyl carrier protein n=1 Tax=Nocardioides aromaticivorans TaxID=200618 RepID=A0A7Y9ZES1_9ACTN|nr:acyl carrier protein [Nocardioides aromaticivorans]NYI44089.1 acyl carrier protein [Nocardioides aromaticivorans]HVK28001.1 acyl carrier protein [Nocardioides sp.]
MTADRVRGVIATFLTGAKKAFDPELPGDTDLYGGGLELDSLEAAELSAMLEDEFGTDPFSAGEEMPETVGEVLAFYEAAATA